MSPVRGPAPLLERAGEREALAALLERARDGHGGVVVIEGPAGIGKSRLLAAAAELAPELGLRTLKARGSPLERELAFGGAVQLVGDPVAAATAEERRELVSGAAGLAMPLLAPGPEAESTLAQPGHGPPPLAFLHGLHWLVANLAERSPLLLAVDDAQWLDERSLRFLDYLAQRLAELPLALAVTVRAGEPEAEPEPLAALRSHPDAQVLRPAPLSDEAVAELVRASYPGAEEEFCRASAVATAGNPLYLRELLVIAHAEGIEPSAASAGRVERLGGAGISRAVLATVGRMAASRRALARAVAVAGDGTPLRHAAAIAGLARRDAVDAADALAAAEVLAASESLSFVHPVVREAVYSDIPAATRGELHLEAARVLAAEGAPGAGRVAAQLLASGPVGEPWAVAALREAATAARSRGAPDAAVELLRRALDEPLDGARRARLLHELGSAESLGGRTEAAIGHLVEALEGLEDPRERGLAARQLGQALLISARPVDAVEVLDRAAGEVQEAGLRARIEADIAVAGWMDLGARRRALERGARLDDPAIAADMLLIGARALETVLAEPPAAMAIELVRRALREGRLLAEEGADSPAFHMAADTLFCAHDLDAAQRLFTEEIADARRRGSLRGAALAACWRAEVQRRLGHVPAAEADARVLLEAGPEAIPILVPVATAFLAEALVERGQLEEAAVVVEEVDFPGPLAGTAVFVHFPYTRARVRLARGDAEGALAELRECERLEDAWGFRTPAMTQWRADAALALAGLGESAEARRLAAEELERARAFRSTFALGVALRAAGLAAGEDRGIELLAEAVATLEGSPARLELARSLTDLGAVMRRAGRRRDSREPLRRGLDLARRCGALALAERARTELRASGARPRSLVLSGVESLTPSELRVAELAGGGLTNREVAQQLYLTKKTVETHLGHAYRKLAIGSRAELARALGHDRSQPL